LRILIILLNYSKMIKLLY